ncbi:Ser-Thr-rich glycosyl-phosphatidyl-inositol-anchored membrane family-domain-containing protein [Aspergillus egyptiacus]|nr:Ser-Thr-rich glycosyl-phosphatidyl-inositol-anchored membrane family-domain-containing protein [Aspergillus egyptiacus]
MRSVFYFALSAIATLVAAQENPFNIPPSGYEFTAGEPTTLNWEPTTDGTVTLKLQWGQTFTQDSGTVLVSSIPNSGSFTWSVPDDIADRDDYTVEIISDESGESSNYLPRFSVEGAEPAPTTTSSTTTESTTSTTETSTTETSTSTPLTTTTTTETTSTETPASTTSTESTSTSTETPTQTPTEVPNLNEPDDAGMSNRVSSAMLALALGVIAVV